MPEPTRPNAADSRGLRRMGLVLGFAMLLAAGDCSYLLDSKDPRSHPKDDTGSHQGSDDDY